MTTPITSRTVRALRALARAGASTSDLFRETAAQVSLEIPNDGWCGLMLDPATLVMTGGIHEHGLTPTAIRRLLEIEYREDDANLFVDLARARSPAAALSVTAGDALEQSGRFRDVLVPSGYGDELRVVLRSSGATWGALNRARGGRTNCRIRRSEPTARDRILDLAGVRSYGTRRRARATGSARL